MNNRQILERVARAWASIDGKDFDDPEAGRDEGYLSEAAELLKRSGLDVLLSEGLTNQTQELEGQPTTEEAQVATAVRAMKEAIEIGRQPHYGCHDTAMDHYGEALEVLEKALEVLPDVIEAPTSEGLEPTT